MSPRALTDQEKDLQKQRLFSKAQELVLTHGIKRVSVDDIIKAAGMGKAAFYSYFNSKEELLVQLVWEIYQGLLRQAAEMIQGCPRDQLPRAVGAFLQSLIRDADKVFFFRNHEELTQLLAIMRPAEIKDFNQMEYRAFESLIVLAGLDTAKVKPDVVHNYIHAMYFSVSDGCMMPEHIDETVAVMTDGLLYYLFGEVAQRGGE